MVFVRLAQARAPCYCATQCPATWPCLLPSLSLPKRLSGCPAVVQLPLLGRGGPHPWLHIQISKNPGSKSQFCSFLDQHVINAVCRVLLTTGLTRMGSLSRCMVLPRIFLLTAVRSG